MRHLLLLIPILFPLLLSAQTWTDRSRIYPDKLRDIPTAMVLYHSPTPNYPELNTDPKVDTKYVWKHRTCVETESSGLEVVEAGSFIWMGESGWIPNVALKNKDFAKKFDCPKGLFQANTRYCFEENYRYGNDLYAGDALWYVLAKDAAGNLFKGVCIIETEGELKEKK